MALHTGDVAVRDGDYHSLVLHHASRLLMAAHGGQILCSEATAALLRRSLLSDVRLTDLGLYRLRDVPGPERLFQVEYGDMVRRAFPAPNAEAGYASNLPLQLTRFIGRDEEIAALLDMLRPGGEAAAEQGARLVTLTGPGGTGKTRLSLEVAARLLERFSGAVWFVPLGDVADAARIAEAIRDALRLPSGPGGDEPLDQVAEALARQLSLLVLDNFEQIALEGASVVRDLLLRAPTLTCLVTSRQPLRLSGEQELARPPSDDAHQRHGNPGADAPLRKRAAVRGSGAGGQA
jgi:hypothetical protein